MRTLSFIDHCLGQFDQLLALTLRPAKGTRADPSEALSDVSLTSLETKHVIALMRVNHAGEIAAQGLYQGQALTARLPHIRQQMQQAAIEEIDHLAWCRNRLNTLGGRPSYLDPCWYLGSLAIGALAGSIGDVWSLGFIAETERQVSHHLSQHLRYLPAHDHISAAILRQMQIEELQHESAALAAGAAILPRWLQCLMSFTAKIMVTTAARF